MQRPALFQILQNDSWASSSLASFIFSFIINVIVWITYSFTGTLPKNTKLEHFAYLLLAAFLYLVITSFWRIRFVEDLFGHGIDVSAKIVSQKTYKSTWTIDLEYIYAETLHKTRYKQMITQKTKKFIGQNQIMLVVDQRRPKNFLLRDVYL